MKAEDEDMLICDFAETYHILDYRALPVETQAVLAFGLRDNSRIKTKLMGFTPISQDLILARAADSIEVIRYSLTAKEGDPEPELLIKLMTGKISKKKESFGFNSAMEFEAAREKFLKGYNHG